MSLHGLLIQLMVFPLNTKVNCAGTTNFIHGVPYVSVSIGFTVAKHPTVGVVLNPFTSELYTGILSKGSFLTKLSSDLTEPISKTKLPLYPPQPLDLHSSVIAIELGYDRSGNNLDVKFSTFKTLASQQGGMVHGLRSYGSAALNMCQVACGYIDGYWEGGAWEWDVCAGWVILQETGGFVVNGNPEEGYEGDLCGRAYLAVRSGQTEDESKQWVKDFRNCMGGTLEYHR